MKKEPEKNNNKKKPPSPARTIFRVISILIALLLIMSGVFFGAIQYFSSAPGIPALSIQHSDTLRIDEEGYLHLEVRSGESAQSVGSRLEQAGVIRNRHFWNLLFRLDDDHIKTGSYRISLPASPIEIRSILVKGEQLLVRVTIPEGYTLNQIARIFENEGICSAGDFLTAAGSERILETFNIPGSTVEGYLFPDTYLFEQSYPASLVVEVMANNFFRRLRTIAPDSAFMSPEEINERVIMASIVEREYRAPAEAALMAGVFFNRLRIGMALQSCATVVYVMTEILGMPHPERLLYRDLEIRNPYNTYMYPGLPPGPISAPGEVALRGAFEPASSNYLYFRLLDPSSGRHYFSRTLDEHIRAGELYVKGW